MKAEFIDSLERTVPALRRYARSLLGDRSCADDLVQDTLERAIDRWSQVRSMENVRPWVFTILHNLAMTRLKRQSRRPLHLSIQDIDDSAFSEPPSQEDRLRYGDLIAALGELTEEQRAVLLLVAVEDLSYAEAAQILSIPTGTVMSRLSRARARLARLMEGDNKTESSRRHLRSVK